MLSEALSETLSQFGIDPSSVTLTVSPGQSQTNATSQNSDAGSQNSAATIVSPFSRAAAIAATPTTIATSTPSASSTSPTTTSSSSGSGSVSGSGSNGQSASPVVSESYDDAYWAQQPPAVQQLRDITNYQARVDLGTQLAQEGYTIDVPIMVWGWDPSIVMASRQADGYTWVPSALQQPVEMAPGITVPGMASYDPNNPPAGSIRV